jgi:hypothetical protein
MSEGFVANSCLKDLVKGAASVAIRMIAKELPERRADQPAPSEPIYTKHDDRDSIETRTPCAFVLDMYHKGDWVLLVRVGDKDVIHELPPPQPAPSDGEMLEAIQTNRWRVRWALSGELVQVWDGTGALLGEAPTLREAIRAAMERKDV